MGCFKIMAPPAPGVQPAPKSGYSRVHMYSTGLMIPLHVCWLCSTSSKPGSDRQTERQSGLQHWRSLVVCEVCHSSKSMHDLDLQSWLQAASLMALGWVTFSVSKKGQKDMRVYCFWPSLKETLTGSLKSASPKQREAEKRTERSTKKINQPR